MSLQGPEVTGARILMNIVRNNSYGVYLLDSPNTLVTANNIRGNGKGCMLSGHMFID